MKKLIQFIWNAMPLILILAVIFLAGRFVFNLYVENIVLKKIVGRLSADSRTAEVLVTDVRYDENENRRWTTIKFLEYDSNGNPLEPKYFTFPGNIIQFQSLVIRFDDIHIRSADKLRGKSAYLFWKVFMLDGKNTKEYVITDAYEAPEGYRVEDKGNKFEQGLWKQFWTYVLDPEKAKLMGIKNAQIEAPGTVFVPGTLYTIKIEHDGGLRIDSKPLPEILRGEKIE